MNDCKIEVKKESSEQSNELAKAFIIGMALGFAKEYDEMDKVMEEVKKAVTPQPKTGRWIKHDTGHSIYYDCSLCSCTAPCTEVSDSFIWKLSAYCPDCGAKMVEPQESEEI